MIQRIDAGNRMSEASIHGGIAYLAGQVPEPAGADIADFAGMNRAWDAWVTPGNAPARATVEARLANPAWKVEIVVTAVV